MLSIRLARAGANKRPFYHIVVADGRNKRDGRHIERLGFYNPIAVAHEDRLRVDHERVQYWLSVGAKASTRVNHLLSLPQAVQAAA
jgi:small subunit ribosomal protein S16